MAADIVDPPRGGILFRSLRRVSDGSVISGPSLLVDEILRLSEASSIAELVNEKWNGDTSALREVSRHLHTSTSRAQTQRVCLYLRARHRDIGASRERGTLSTRPRIYRSPRIGLDLSHPSIPAIMDDTLKHPRVVFVAKMYRYFCHPNLLTANGRGQTFLGVCGEDLHKTVQAGDTEDESKLAEVIAATGLKMVTAQKYLQDYLQGYRTGSLKSFIGAAGKGASSSPTTFLRMMGTLMKARESAVDIDDVVDG